MDPINKFYICFLFFCKDRKMKMSDRILADRETERLLVAVRKTSHSINV